MLSLTHLTYKCKNSPPILCGLAIILTIGSNAYAQVGNSATEQRWIGFWADTSWLQNGILDVTINSNGIMTGSIINGTHKGTWNGQINNNGVLMASYQYNEEQIRYDAKGFCRLNNGQLIGNVDFIYKGLKMSKGNFALAPANSIGGTTSSSPSVNSDLSKALETKPVGNPDLLKNGNPNVNDYRNNYKGYIDQLVPAFSDLVKGELDSIKNYGKYAPTSNSGPNSSNNSAKPSNGQPPASLLQAWISPNSGYGVTTYDFTQMEAYGQRTVSIRGWQKSGSLGWQSNQNFTNVSYQYNSASNEVAIKSTTGYQEQWKIIKVEDSKMLIESKGRQFYVFNCSDPGWPYEIKAAMRGCR